MAKATATLRHDGPAFLILSQALAGTVSAVLGAAITRLVLPVEHTSADGWGWLGGAAFSGVAISLAYYYWMICGYAGHPKGSPERGRYNNLRTGLRRGGGIGRAYEALLRSALYRLDIVLGDSQNRPSPSLPLVMGIKDQAHIWTAQSYDRCLLFAVVYPVFGIICAWSISGHVGPAEVALSLPANTTIYQRGTVFIGAVVLLVSWVQFMRQQRLKIQALWMVATCAALLVVLGAADAGKNIVVFALALALAFGGAVMFVVARLGTTAFRGAGSGTVAFAVTAAVLVATGNTGFQKLGGGLGLFPTAALAFSFALIASCCVCASLLYSISRGLFGYFLVFGTILTLTAALASPVWLATWHSWNFAGPIVLFLVILTVANAPFDWIALGVTRFLLRRGLERGAWWPLIYGLIDLLVAGVVVVLLAVSTFILVEWFSYVTVLTGAEPVIHPDKILAALQDPTFRHRPEYVWLSVMLYSTLLPSVLNVSLGALSIMRGIPGLNSSIARRMPVGRPVLGVDRMWISAVLTLEVILSIIVGAVMMLGVLLLVVTQEVGFLGGGLLDLLRHL